MNNPLAEVAASQWYVLPLYFLPAIINVGLLLYILLFLKPRYINRIFALYIFLLAFGQVTDGIMHICVTEDAAMIWSQIALAPWFLITPFGVMLVNLLFADNKDSRLSWLTMILVLPSLVFIFFNAGKSAEVQMIYSDSWGWLANPVPTTFTAITYLYIACVGILSVALLWYHYFHSHIRKIRQQALLMAMGMSVPYLGGVIGEAIFPLVYGLDTVPITCPLMTVFTILTLIAISKYQMLNFSPSHQIERIMQNVQEGILMVDNGGIIQYVNKTGCRLLGYSETELVGSSPNIFLGKNSTPDFWSKKSPLELQIQTKAGEPEWFLASAAPCEDENGKQIGTTCTLTTVDRLKKTESEFNRSQQRLKRAQSIAHIGHWELDFATGKGVWSEETCRIYGLPPDQNVQTFHSWLSLIHPGDLDAVKAELKRSHDTASDIDMEHRILLKDGTVKFVRSISKLEFDSNHNPMGLYGNCQDITHTRLVMDEAISSAKELETYIYKSSHDLHGPLTSILGLIDVSKLEVKDPLARRYLEMIESQTRKLSSIREQFIHAMQIKAGTHNSEPLLIRDLINQILNAKATLPRFKRMHVHVNIPQDIVLQSNYFLLKTVLENLIRNAVRFQDYSKSDPFLNIDVFKQGNYVKITIQDNGVGISEEIQHRVFEMYFKGANSVDGAGLGLYLTKKAMDKLGGRMEMKSTPGLGTTFELAFRN